MVMLASTAVVGVTSRMINDNSRMVEIKLSRNPETKPVLVSGKMIRQKRRHGLAPAIVAASSNSLLTCSMADTPVRAENGRCFATDTTTSRANVPYNGGMGPTGLVNMEMY